MSEIKTEPKHLKYLHPEWIERNGKVTGVRFYCPCGTPPLHVCDEYCDRPCRHRERPGCAFGVMTVMFRNDDDPPIPEPQAHYLWRRRGETFDDLTIEPSIHALGHVHGFVTHGIWRNV